MFDSNPSRQPIMRTVVRTISPVELLMALVIWAGVLGAVAMRADGQEPPPALAAGDPAEAERQAVWNSPPMLAARSWLEEYFRTSRRSPPEVEQAYLDHLSQLSAEQMRQWLKQMSAMRGRLFEERQNTATVRQWSYNQARQAQLASRSASRRAVVTPTPARNYSQPNFVQPESARRAAEAAALRNRYEPLRSFQLLYFLDTLDIRDDLRELRNQGQ